MEKIKFTIAIATYNSAKVIKELLLSIYNQTYTNFEVVIIDGVSTDETLNIVKKWLRPCDKLLSEKDKGVYDAMNKALDIASGDYLIFMGSDDHFLSYRVLYDVAIAINGNDKDKEAIFYGGCYMDKYHQVMNTPHNRWSWVRGTMCHQCIFYPKSVYKKYKYDLKYKINADYAYNLSLWGIVDFKHIDVIISYFNDGGISDSGNYDLVFRKDLPLIIRERCGFMPYIYKLLRLLMGKIFKDRP